MEQNTQREKLIDLIVNAKKAYPETESFTEFLADFLIGYGVIVPDDTYDLSRLRAMVQADREGKYAALPCKLGEILWCINSYGEVEETGAVGFLIEKESVCIYYREKMSSEYYNAPIGKVLFLTREAAEEALKGENP